MIEKEYEKYDLICDACGRYIPRFDTFQDALNYAEEMDWVKRKEDGEWVNICEDCQGDE